MTRRNMVLSTVSALGATLLPTAAAQPTPAVHEGNAGGLLDLVSLDDFERAARERMAAMAYLFGLAAGGAAGVSRVVEILRDEFKMAMALTGRRTLAEIDRTVIG